MKNVIHFPAPTEAVHINDETMSKLTNEQLVYRIWDMLDSTVEMIGSPDDPASRDHWLSNQPEAYCSALEGQICARVLARRVLGVEPRSIQQEQTRRLRLALGISVDGGEA